MFAQPKTFTFLWHVKNFSMCPVDVGSSITSPIFEAGIFKNSRWSLVLYPKGNKANNKVTCHLKCNGIGSYNREICTDFSIAVAPRVSNLLPFSFEREKSIGVFVISVEELLKNKNKFLPGDTLTIQCVLSCRNEGDKESEITDALTWEDFSKEDVYSINKCSVKSTIQVHTKSLFWEIKSFDMLPMHKKLTLPVFSGLDDSPSLYVTLFKLETELAIIINYKKQCGNYFKNFVKCGISVTDILGDVKYHSESEFLLKPDIVWNFPPFVKFSELEESKYFDHTGDVLFLRFDFAISVEDQLHHAENQFFVPTYLPNINKVVLDAEKLFSEGEHSIISLKAGDKTFLAHRSVLSAASEVFEAMFENDMTERGSGVVEIPDVEPETVGQMLTFIYTHVVDVDLSFSDIFELFAVADKYRVKSLMAFCCSYLASSLTFWNVCMVLELADRHSNKLLMESVEVFIRSDSDRILTSKRWMEFMKSNSSLAASIMHKMLIG